MKTITLPYEEYQEMQNEIEKLQTFQQAIKQKKMVLLYETEYDSEIFITKDDIDCLFARQLQSLNNAKEKLSEQNAELKKQLKNKKFIWWTK